MAKLKPWTRESKNCEFCKKTFVAQIYKRRRFCSSICSNKHKIEFPESNPQWAGAKSYGLRHAFIKKRLGRAHFCSACGQKSIKKAKQFDWANVSLEYKTDLNDWVSLCRKCHQNWDDGFIAIRINNKLYQRPHRLCSYKLKRGGVYLKKSYKIKK